MTEISFILLKQLATLAQGRSPILVPQSWVYGGSSGPPTLITDGVDVDGAIVAKVGVRLRKSPDLWRSWLRVDTNDAGETFGVDFDGTAVVVSGDAGGAALTIADLKTEIEADGDFIAANGTASLVTGQDGVLEIAFPTKVAVVESGTGVQSLLEEATSVVWRLWGLPLGIDQWAVIRDEPARHAVDAFELEDALARGWRRFYLEVLGADGACLPFVGPARSEVNQASLLEDAANLLPGVEALLYSFATSSDGGQLVTASALGKVGLAGGVKTQQLVSVSGDTELLPLDPTRRGYLLRNLGAAEVWVVNVTSQVAAATNGHLKLGADEAKAVSGEAAGNAVRATDNGAGPHNVWVESW